jgi:hypothetical protein
MRSNPRERTQPEQSADNHCQGVHQCLAQPCGHGVAHPKLFRVQHHGLPRCHIQVKLVCWLKLCTRTLPGILDTPQRVDNKTLGRMHCCIVTDDYRGPSADAALPQKRIQVLSPSTAYMTHCSQTAWHTLYNQSKSPLHIGQIFDVPAIPAKHTSSCATDICMLFVALLRYCSRHTKLRRLMIAAAPEHCH